MNHDGPRSRHVAELIGWSAVAGVGSVMLTQAIGFQESRLVAAGQALTPYGIPVVAAVTAAALWRRSHVLATVSATVGLAALALAAPIVFPTSQPRTQAGAGQVSVATVNLLYSNSVVDRVADRLVERDPDLIVFSEYTSSHRSTLLGHRIADRYRYQIDGAAPHAGGMAIWSKFELDENPETAASVRAVEATVGTPFGAVEIFAVHPPTPIQDHRQWNAELGVLGELATASPHPTLIIGDFNAAYWHPGFRDLLQLGFTDAHIAHGQGWSPSWPTDELVPPFVRLDHALTGNGLVSTGVDDFGVPGSDHAGLVVTVSPAAN